MCLRMCQGCRPFHEPSQKKSPLHASQFDLHQTCLILIKLPDTCLCSHIQDSILVTFLLQQNLWVSYGIIKSKSFFRALIHSGMSQMYATICNIIVCHLSFLSSVIMENFYFIPNQNIILFTPLYSSRTYHSWLFWTGWITYSVMTSSTCEWADSFFSDNPLNMLANHIEQLIFEPEFICSWVSSSLTQTIQSKQTSRASVPWLMVAKVAHLNYCHWCMIGFANNTFIAK